MDLREIRPEPELPIGTMHPRAALAHSGYVSGSANTFYKYPARFSPEFARAFICRFSKAGDWVLDPFMGGATSIVEGLALGRRMAGVDINALSHFIATTRTSPLSQADAGVVTSWAQAVSERPPHHRSTFSAGIRNLPPVVEDFMAGALAAADKLGLPRQRRFSRCALLRLGQWALECRNAETLEHHDLAGRLPVLVESMLSGLDELVSRCRAQGVRRNKITGQRLLLNRDAVGIGTDSRFAHLHGRVKLVVTSPPYPGVHVLYHRWQLQGRRETAAPYWIAAVQDGQAGSYYTFGGRSAIGIKRYFETVQQAFASLRPLLAPDGLVAQLVAFSDVERHLPPYLEAMTAAGFAETEATDIASRERRQVPHRKWYVRVRPDTETGCELLLLHRAKT